VNLILFLLSSSLADSLDSKSLHLLVKESFLFLSKIEHKLDALLTPIEDSFIEKSDWSLPIVVLFVYILWWGRWRDMKEWIYYLLYPFLGNPFVLLNESRYFSNNYKHINYLSTNASSKGCIYPRALSNQTVY